jgi:serine/threonine protein phosphatase PrpC
MSENIQLIRINPDTKKELDILLSPEILLIDGSYEHKIIDNKNKKNFKLDSYYSGKTNKSESKMTNMGKLYGQDYVGIIDLDDNTKILHVSDGHGSQGHQIAERSANLLIRYFQSDWIKLKDYLINNNITEFEKVIKENYMKINNIFINELSGTTSTFVIITIIDNKSFIITINLGDSPSIIINSKTGKVTQTHWNCSWDDEHEYNNIINYCSKQNIKPPKVIAGRFNTKSGKKLNNTFLQDSPFIIYNREPIINEPHIKALILESWNQNKIGGFQSVRKMTKQMYIHKEQKWVDILPIEGYEHKNYGATPLINNEGLCQITRSFGDVLQKKYVLQYPNIYIHELSEDDECYVIVMSDGLSDKVYYYQLSEKCLKYHNLSVKEIVENIITEVYESAGGYIRDDVSIALCRIKIEN